MTAIGALMDGLIDYAGLYPPAGLDMATAVRNYLGYMHSKHAFALGRFIVDVRRLEELLGIAGPDIAKINISLIVSTSSDWDSMRRMIDNSPQVQVLESKIADPKELEGAIGRLPSGVPAYFEVPVDPRSSEVLDAVCAAGARVKLRMGGLTERAFPSADAIAEVLQLLAARHLIFKATAGLHHPLHSTHPLAHIPDRAVVSMHGFVNLFFAAALIYFGSERDDSYRVLSETNRAAWGIAPEAITWRGIRLDVEKIREVRREFFVSFGSCSFTEPIDDLEALGWL